MQSSVTSSRAFEQSEMDLVRQAAAGDVVAVRHIIKTHNQRLYRLVRAILRSNADAEEVLQEAYLNAFSSLGGFGGEASLSTWLSRIAINAALMRIRAQKRRKRTTLVLTTGSADIIPFPLTRSTDDPERTMAQRQMGLSQIFCINGMLTIGEEIPLPE